MKFPKLLTQKLEKRIEEGSYRELAGVNESVDFASNDYLGLSRKKELFEKAHFTLSERGIEVNGATGSRLISGNHLLYTETEEIITGFHKAEAALIFNSGYDANLGFFSCVPQKGDVVFYDEWIHASIRDGLRLSAARSFKFRHNDLESLKSLLSRHANGVNTIYVVTESIFSMDGDSPDLISMAALTDLFGALLVVDEAHAVGVSGEKGEGMVPMVGLESKVFARIVTFGKAIGTHGAAVLGSKELKSYLVNFARSFIYTTALPPHTLMTIQKVYNYIQWSQEEQEKLRDNILFFNQKVTDFSLKGVTCNNTPIQTIMIPGNRNVKSCADLLQRNSFFVKPILSPTVPEGTERLRFCIHSFNTADEMSRVLEWVKKAVG